MRSEVLAIVNPVSAAKSTGRLWPDIYQKFTDNKVNLDYVYTEYPEHAIELSRKAILDGYKTILAVGGDGTLNEVVNGFFESGKILNKETRLAILSMGTGCDFIKTLGLSKKPEDIINILKCGTHRKCNIGMCKFVKHDGSIGERYFINVSDVGLGGDTTYRVNKTSKVLKGFFSFLIGTLISILFYKNRVFEINIDHSIIIKEKLNSVFICNGKYIGGGMKIAPDALLDDNLLNVYVLGNLSKIELFYNFPLIYKGEHIKNPKIKEYKAKYIKISSKEDALIEIDGEQPGKIEAEFFMLEETLNILT